MRLSPVSSLILAVAAALAGCGGREPAADPVLREEDPALASALAEPITYDPDLASMNRANSAASLPPQDGFLPTIDQGPDAIAAARAEAVTLVGGPGQMRQAPEPVETSIDLAPAARLTAAGLAAATPGVDAACADEAQYTMHWAARLPPAFPVYPRGAVQEAAGTQNPRCRLRVVKFVTPVPLVDVIDFYFTRARGAGYSAERTRHAGEDRLSGTRAAAAYVIYARTLPSGLTEVDLITR